MNIDPPIKSEDWKDNQEPSCLKIGQVMNPLTDQVTNLMFDYYSKQKINFLSIKYEIEEDEFIPLYKEIIRFYQGSPKLLGMYLMVPGDD